jgi:hypothetical protein
MHYGAERAMIGIGAYSVCGRDMDSRQQQQQDETHRDHRPHSTRQGAKVISQLCLNIPQQSILSE